MSRQTRAAQRLWLVLGAAVLLLAAARPAPAQLRIVSWNTATGDSSPGYAGRQTDFNRVLDFIGREQVNGVVRPIDVLILQEQSDASNSPASFAAEMNAITGTSNYVAWTQNPFDTDGLDAGFVYNSATVTPFLQDWFGTGSSRATARLGFSVVGYSNASIYAYSTHHTAGTGQGDLTERRDEAFDLRIVTGSGSTNSGPSGVAFGADALAADANIIYAGDFNQKTSFEEPTGDPFAWTSNPYEILKLSTELGTSGNGQAVDPINAPGSWTNNSSFASIHTQSPHDGSFGLVTGGMDDRFDFQMVSTELNDGEGLSYIGPNAGDSTASTESYHTFGNNGTTYNQAANSSSNTGLDWIITQGETLGGMNSTQTRNAVRNSLARASDHSPVVVDYQLPAKMDVTVGSTPAQVIVGASVQVDVTVSNDAPVTLAVGADELDYDVTSSGDLSGSATSQVDQATGGGNVHQLTLSTATAGAKSGDVMVDSLSQSVEDGDFDQSVVYHVLDHANGSFASGSDENTLTVDFGIVQPNAGTISQGEAIHHLVATPGFTAALDLDSIGAAGDHAVLTTTLATFSDLAAGGSSGFDVEFDTSAVQGMWYEATYTLSLSDEDLPGEASSAVMSLVIKGAITVGGDANLDGLVNSADLSILASNFGVTAGGTWATGDWNGDGMSNSSDLSILASLFGFMLGAGGDGPIGISLEQAAALAGLSINVPEPATLTLVLCGLCVAGARRCADRRMR